MYVNRRIQLSSQLSTIDMQAYIQSCGHTNITHVIVKFLHKYIIYYYYFFKYHNNYTLLSDHNVAIINARTFSMKNHKPY